MSLCCTNQDMMRFFVCGLAYGRPSWFLQEPASFSNLADLMVEFWSDSFSWLSRGCCTRLVADIVTILSCFCYSLNGQKLSSNTLSIQLPNYILSNFICFFKIWQLSTRLRTVLLIPFENHRSGNTGRKYQSQYYFVWFEVLTN